MAVPCDWCGRPTRRVTPVYVAQRADEQGFAVDEDPPFGNACPDCAEGVKAGRLSVGLDRPRLGRR